MKRGPIVMSIVIMLFVLSCSGSSPVAPDSSLPDELTSGHESQGSPGSAYLWGIWDIHIDVENGVIEAVPLRGPAFACNVVQYVDGPPLNLLFTNLNMDVQTGYTDISLDVGLQHPFPGLNMYTGFDVLGVFMGDGTSAYPGSEGFAVAGENDQQLLNPDGYTRWFNAPEFTGAGETMALLGYYPGALGSPGYIPSAVLNPYKYFTDGLEKDDAAFDFLVNNGDNRGCFMPGSINYREYEIRFPDSVGITFQYAVIAHWEPPENQGESLDDFPISANAAEAVAISVVDTSTLYYIDGTTNGGNAILDISVYDWSATTSDVMEEYIIKCYSDAWSGDGAVDMTPISSGDNYYTYQTNIPATSLTSDDPLPVWIEINYPELDYANEFGVGNDADGALAGYFHTEIPVDDEAPEPEIGWALTWGGYNEQYGEGVAIDDSGNIFVTGWYYSLTDFDPDPDDEEELYTNGWQDAYISKFDSSGDFLWVRTWGAFLWDEGLGVAVDSSGNVYITGFFCECVNFDPCGGHDLHTSNGSGDAYLSKFDTDGNFLWARTWGGTSWDEGLSLTVDDNDDIYVSGCFRSSVDFDPEGSGGVYEFTSNGGEDAYLSKFDPDGYFQWARAWGGDQWDLGRGVAFDGSGGIYVAGYFTNTVDFDPDPGNIVEYTGDNDGDAYVSKFDLDGIFQWARTWGGSQMDDVNKHGVAANSTGIYVTGNFRNIVDFDPEGSGGVWEYTSIGHDDTFITKFDSSGDFAWAYTWGNASGDQGWGITADDFNNVYVSGHFMGSVDFDPDPVEEDIRDSSTLHTFLSKFGSDGTYQWVRTFGGDEQWTDPRDVTVSNTGSIFLTGFFDGITDFDPGPGEDLHEANGWNDAFLVKILPNGYWE